MTTTQLQDTPARLAPSTFHWPAGFDPASLNNSVNSLTSAVNGLQSEVTGLAYLTHKIRTEERGGIAATAAMAAAPMPSAPGRTSWAVNSSVFKGQAGFGASVAHRLDIAIPIALTAGYSYGGNNNHVARLGLQGEF